MKFTKQHYEIKDGIVTIYDSKGISFCIDEQDLEILSEINARWNTFTTNRSAGKYYVQSRINSRTIYLHRILLGVEDRRVQIDHIDGNPLNNCRSNLRIVTDSENKQNRHKADNRNKSGYRGVFWNNQRQKWNAKVQINKTQHHVGFFDDVHEAGRAAAEARRQLMSHSNESSIETEIVSWKKPVGRETSSKSGVHGVCWSKQAQKWMALTTKNRRNVFHGYFDTIEEARVAVEAARANLNQ